jgi:hypothetical protein
MTQQTTQPSKRMYKGERYLRADHLMKGGKFIAVKVKVSDVVHGLPAKIMGKDADDTDGKGVKMMPGLVFDGKDKVLGLNITNESNLCWETGEGNWPGWIGKEILLVVRLVKSYNKQSRSFEEIPCIRIWPRQPHPNGRVRDQMGVEVPDSWYASARSDYLANQKQMDEQEKPADKQPDKPPVEKPPEFNADERARWISIFERCISEAKDGNDIGVCRTRFTALGSELDKHKMPLTLDERKVLSDKLSAVAKAIKEKQDGGEL